MNESPELPSRCSACAGAATRSRATCCIRRLGNASSLRKSASAPMRTRPSPRHWVRWRSGWPGLPAKLRTLQLDAPGRIEEANPHPFRVYNRPQTQAVRAAHELMREYARRTDTDMAALRPLFGSFVIGAGLRAEKGACAPAGREERRLPRSERRTDAGDPARAGDGEFDRGRAARLRAEPPRGPFRGGGLHDAQRAHAGAAKPREPGRPRLAVGTHRATVLDSSPLVESFVKYSGLGFAIPYTLRGTTHD